MIDLWTQFFYISYFGCVTFSTTYFKLNYVVLEIVLKNSSKNKLLMFCKGKTLL